MQYNVGEGARERGGANDLNCEQADKGASCSFAAVHAHTQANEKRIHLLHGTLDECLSSKVGHISNIFATRAAGLVSARL